MLRTTYIANVLRTIMYLFWTFLVCFFAIAPEAEPRVVRSRGGLGQGALGRGAERGGDPVAGPGQRVGTEPTTIERLSASGQTSSC